MRRFLEIPAQAAALACTDPHAATDAESPQGLLKGRLPDNQPALRRVAIANFFVQCVTDFGVEKKRSSNTFHSKLDNLPPELMQATADAAGFQGALVEASVPMFKDLALLLGGSR